jgi:hypothetical protein
MSQSLFVCKKCGYEWTPRKTLTRFKRQCPKCNSYEIDATINASQSLNNPTKTLTIANAVSTARTNLPAAAYDLMGITQSSSVENAIMRANELYKKLYWYKIKYNLDSLEEVFSFLEKETLAAHKKANEADERLQGILANPENVFFEAGGDLAAVNWYNALRNSGYKKSFSDFLSEAVNGYWEAKGYELAFREKQEQMKECGI